MSYKKMSEVFELPVDINEYTGLAPEVDDNCIIVNNDQLEAIQLSVNSHDALVSKLDKAVELLEVVIENDHPGGCLYPNYKCKCGYEETKTFLNSLKDGE